uniref:Uncharacterized protein n=1 Tax=Anguilla anguilla TaxID=7936 RepID=A0A0E9QG51_ANGAN
MKILFFDFLKCLYKVLPGLSLRYIFKQR